MTTSTDRSCLPEERQPAVSGHHCTRRSGCPGGEQQATHADMSNLPPSASATAYLSPKNSLSGVPLMPNFAAKLPGP
eukprot:2161381-Pleurochrysis_carterae.AAC.1